MIDNNYQTMLWELAGSGATREAITKQQIENLQIIVPPIELQNQFADFVKHIDKLKFTLKQTLEKLENCYHSLMQEYFE
jgi:type I restriction enzyme S subunit